MSKHDCATKHRFHPERNKADLAVGTIWTCPDCNSPWMRVTKTFDGISYLYGVQPALWKRLNWFQRLTINAILSNIPAEVK